ncbi:hypothetical protein K493DRAFT_236922 [Basidiobolus meristosporus CBS 931.73]|uniref:Oxo-4-hydroxy-4-carboxy-5-ureidoimidazoline decarboxylase domain-containing protein n=1 Tax=Basidiobolus meristosporus CBS 931.73 TaxID=1314790 RepID=A0A1Y1XS74_9FUNG|nr:hypothetical protein K493DRAFT_236922 [Basidiobolus meristosporus CBS 931.73]|eukprot:ORX88164.1 hypothetical protein K493DRAFT_236922 [Basidiobolus meristosporus CBS 931.73]
MPFPPISKLNELPEPEFLEAINSLFEPAPPLAKILYEARPYISYSSLLDFSQYVIDNDLSHEDRILVVNAHPRIGAPPQGLSAHSIKEQGYDRKQTPEEEQVNARLKELNEAYEKKYGFKFVVFVNGRPRKDIVPVLEKRLSEGTQESELKVGLSEMLIIARDRLRKLQAPAKL